VSRLRSAAAGMPCPPRGTTCSSVWQAIRPITPRNAPRPRGPRYSSHSPRLCTAYERDTAESIIPPLIGILM
jgi:hypothetical protein